MAFAFPDADASPMEVLESWLHDARALGLQNHNAMTLATASPDGLPAVRVVLCKALEADQRMLRFFTGYQSAKSQALDRNPRSALNFYWDPAGRQVRVEGMARRSSREVSEAYFRTRPREAKLGAWASLQSERLQDRATFEKRLQQTEERFKGSESSEIPCPEHWGGWDIEAHSLEFWMAGEHRLHHRRRFRYLQGRWESELLYP